MQVALTPWQMELARFVAIEKNRDSVAHGRQGTHGSGPPGTEQALDNHYWGNCCEIAVARAFNLFWDGGVGDIRSVDVGDKVEVRSAQLSGHKLRMHHEDAAKKGHLPFVLVTKEAAPVFNLRGWIFGAEGTNPAWWSTLGTNRGGAFWVPQSALRPMTDLQEYLDSAVSIPNG